MTLTFQVLATDSDARRGVLQTDHGRVDTPVFMPVGTQGSVKGVSPDELWELGAQIILANTYHLFLRPGTERLRSLGGLHTMMGWSGPLLTDSGGYQAYSLKALRKITDEGITFASHIDGSRHVLTPQVVMDAQFCIGSDIMMPLDDCPGLPCSDDRLELALSRSTAWELECLRVGQQRGGTVFAIVQGGTSEALRRRHALELAEHPFDGFAIGGLAVGEERGRTYDTVEHTAKLLPSTHPRYLMGVGTPADILMCIERGVDMFDCVLPTRNARNGQVFTRNGKLNLRNARFAEDNEPIDGACGCYSCRTFGRAYIRHLLRCREILGVRLTTLHNLNYFIDLVAGARLAIERGQYQEYRRACAERWSGAE